jgi:hypothetical protein
MHWEYYGDQYRYSSSPCEAQGFMAGEENEIELLKLGKTG